MTATLNLNTDLDQSGTTFQRVKVWMGPSLGWQEVFVKPTISVTTGGALTLQSGNSLALVNVAATVTINLPDVVRWLRETAYLPAVGFERAIWIKDLGGNAAAFNITVDGFGSQTIDGSLTQVISTNFGILRLYPLNDGSGWFVG